jgi:hypothetical protein
MSEDEDKGDPCPICGEKYSLSFEYRYDEDLETKFWFCTNVHCDFEHCVGERYVNWSVE